MNLQKTNGPLILRSTALQGRGKTMEMQNRKARAGAAEVVVEWVVEEVAGVVVAEWAAAGAGNIWAVALLIIASYPNQLISGRNFTFQNKVGSGEWSVMSYCCPLTIHHLPQY